MSRGRLPLFPLAVLLELGWGFFGSLVLGLGRGPVVYGRPALAWLAGALLLALVLTLAGLRRGWSGRD